MPKWVKEHTVAALTLVGLVLYGVARLSYATFYDVFGVEPEEVGVNYATAITRAWPGLVTALVIWLLLMFAMFGAMAALGWIWRKLRHKEGETEWAMFASILVGVVGVLLLQDLPDRTDQMARDVEQGETLPLGTGFFDLALYQNPLSLRVEDVRLVWVDGSPPAGLGMRPGGTFTYLGRTADTVVVYDRAQKRTIRIPASAVVLVNSVLSETTSS